MTLSAPATVHHSAITVSNLERSVAFYERLGFAVEGRAEVVAADGERGTGISGASLNIAMMAAANSRLELIEYATAKGSAKIGKDNNVGSAHVCVEVDDIDAAVELLRGDGIEFVSEPLHHESGVRWVYLKDPDGITAELLQVLDED